MTFDRLRPDRECRYYLSATKRYGPYRALAVPATMAIGPSVARSLARIDRVAEAIQENAWISEERRRFLIGRIPYWNSWARNPDRGFVHAGDWE